MNYIIPSIFSKKSNYENEQSKDFVWYRHKYLALKKTKEEEMIGQKMFVKFVLENAVFSIK